MELYEKNGQVAVLVSHGFGAGWSTWTQESYAYDKRVVEFWLAHKDDEKFMHEVSAYACRKENAAYKEAEEFFRSIGAKTCPYMGGFEDIELHWVDKGERFVIREYDGAESLEIIGPAYGMCFE